MLISLMKVRKTAEKQLNSTINRKDAKEILDYCNRKLHYIEKEESYLPLLYESELVSQMNAREIHRCSSELMKFRKEKVDYVRRMSSDTVSSMLS